MLRYSQEKLYTKTDANQIAAELSTGEEEGWHYLVVCRAGYETAEKAWSVAIYDNEGYFTGYW